MRMWLIKVLLWAIEHLHYQPNDKVGSRASSVISKQKQVAYLILKTAGKFLTWPNQTVYYKNRYPL